MEEYSGSKRGSSGLFLFKRGSGFSLRDTQNSRNQSIPVCSRLGCSSRMSSSSSTRGGLSNKAKSAKQPFRFSTNGKEIIGSSSKPFCPSNNPRKLGSDRGRKLPSQQGTDLKSSKLQDKSHLPEPILEPEDSQIRLKSEPKVDVHGETTSQDASSSTSSRHSKNCRKATGKYELCDHSAPASSSSTSLPFRNGSFGARHVASTSRYAFKNLNCGSISDVVPSSCSSSSESSCSGRKDLCRKRIGEVESSLSARQKKMNGPRVDANKGDVSYRGGISISDSRRTQNLAASRRDSNNNSTGTGIGSSVGAQRSTTRARLTEQENRSRWQRTDSSILSPLLAQPDTTLRANGSRSEYQFPAQSLSRASSSSRPGSSSESLCSGGTITPFEVGCGHSFMNGENPRQYNLDGIAEMLLALDRIEQDEELTYEQLLVLETNLYLGGPSFYDQHRDMRLDIDNMSYEELLALEERMGIVSTALTEEQLENCLEKSIFECSSEFSRDAEEGAVGSEHGDDIRCSICQEEYVDGNHVGKLGCEHRYHVECVSQWLRVKNWCPICKTSALPLDSPSLPSAEAATPASSPL